ncbi:hypothetical protein [Anaeromyxobacter dehalogenans]|uniref:Uncharacterized protein n=1 Tax=Anaeromyxobacter dehalogenans (strain 2CP-C) TaxID=290397 RepID=Q2IEN3_ANADE|nr:hypothetical protein [Anaeromyxobacter dehalogenans]ABC83045.1 hypothetical protein Adeh_3277 [Anaeromyxobacter dehalogenans 2CP-C]
MDKHLSPFVFGADLSKEDGHIAWPAYRQTSAKEVGFAERWLQNAIERDPSLVVSPCTQAGFTNERWWFWASEFPVDVGSIDILLVSESGRVAIVETKLSTNPEARRSVLAQLLDYAVHLGEVEVEALPDVPEGVEASSEEIARRIHEERDYLLVVAGDQLNPRAVKLGRTLLGDHMLNEWELALVEVTVFERMSDAGGPKHILVPHIKAAIEVERRQTVKVEVEGDRSRVLVERLEPGKEEGPNGPWTEQSFLAALGQAPHMRPISNLAVKLTEIERTFPGAHVRWGTGKGASALLKKNGRTLIEIYVGWGHIVLAKDTVALEGALGKAGAKRWLEVLTSLFPEQMKMTKPTVRGSDPRLAEVLPLVVEVLGIASTKS